MQRILTSTMLLFLFSTGVLCAQTTGGLEVGEVVIGPGERPVVLPPARKGEVIDTVMYQLPPGDSLIYGARISNLDGDGGNLPVDGEFAHPLVLNAEASIGSFVSPRGRVTLEYARDVWNVRGLVDLRSTGGHVDGAEGTALDLAADAEYQIQGDLPSPGKARVGAGIEYQSDDYTLFGNTLDQSDRSRSRFGFDLRLSSETDQAFDYDVTLAVETIGVDDDSATGSARKISATTPEFGARFRIGSDSLALRAGLRYRTVSLDYDRPTQSVDFLEAEGVGEWSPSAGLYVTVGLVAARGDYSDSGSNSLIMPRAAVRYELNRTLGLFGRFAPELRAPSYRARSRSAPYADAEIELRPERVPIDLAAGVRIGAGRTDVEVEAGYAAGENTPVVTIGGDAGVLQYAHRDFNTITLAARATSELTDKINLRGEFTLSTDVDDSTDQQLPMRPVLETRLGGDLRATEKLDFTASILFQSEQNVTWDPLLLPAGVDNTLDPRFLVDVGATYQLIEHLQLFADLTNLLALNYDAWQGYAGEGIEVRVGGRGRF